MTTALLPVKIPTNAKRRLAAVLTAEERSRLAWLLYRQTLSVLLSSDCLDEVVVASSDAETLGYARGEGAEVITEATQHSHSHSAEAALSHCFAMGAARVLLVPIDVPLLTAADVGQVIAAGGSSGKPEIVIVPSRDRTGTNALLLTPPAAIPCRFGPDSFYAHCREAALREIGVKVATPPGLTFDLDEPEDIISLMNTNNDGDLSRYLAEISAAGRAEKYVSRKHFAAQSRT